MLAPLPYRLQAVLKAIEQRKTIVIVEGEKDADNLAKLGIEATCNHGGAGKWRSDLTPHFAGAAVVLIGDNDQSGRDHVRKVAAELISTATSVRVVDIAQAWPDCPHKGDVSDWIEAFGTDACDVLWKAIDVAPAWVAQAEAQPDDREHVGAGSRVPPLDIGANATPFPGTWRPGAPAWPPKDSLLGTLLRGCFLGDDDAALKCDLLAETAASAALGMATRLRNPLAIVMHGKSAENGKSQMQTALAAVLPPSAVCSVAAAEMGDERHIVGLVGKQLNIVGELSGASIASEKFKAVVTGDWVSGRDVFKSRAEFRPVAQHVFATNVLPSFRGGMDRGVRRRLCVLTFNRTVPENERIEDIGHRIGEEEPDLLLAWVVAGATRLITAGQVHNPGVQRSGTTGVGSVGRPRACVDRGEGRRGAADPRAQGVAAATLPYERCIRLFQGVGDV